MRRAPCRPQPPWWPAGEPWPPRHGAHGSRSGPPRGPQRFYRRAALVVLVVVALAAYGAFALVTRLAGGAVAVALVVASAVLLLAIAAGRIGRPLGDIVRASERVAGGDFAVRVGVHGPPWLRSVATAFNEMTARLALQQRQRRELMADIAHELRTPLTALEGRLEGMVDGVYPRDASHVADALDTARLLGRLVEDLRTLAHSDGGTLTLQKEPTDPAVLLDETALGVAAAAAAGDVSVTVDVPLDLPIVDVDPVRIREAVTNLLTNAIRHSPAGATVVLAARPSDRAPGLEITVADHGAGIPAEALPHVFDRFYKGAASTGTGLGLTIARGLIEAHGGTLRASSQEGAGTTMSITLPPH